MTPRTPTAAARILAYVVNHGPVPQQILASTLGLHITTVTGHLAAFRAVGKLAGVRQGRETIWRKA